MNPHPQQKANILVCLRTSAGARFGFVTSFLKNHAHPTSSADCILGLLSSQPPNQGHESSDRVEKGRQFGSTRPWWIEAGTAVCHGVPEGSKEDLPDTLFARCLHGCVFVVKFRQ